MSGPSEGYSASEHHKDVQVLHSMGYAQELERRMSAFSNFAISFSIICILAGGITAFQLGFSAGGGAAIGIGWPLSCAFSLIVAASMGQIASAYPTAGGLYHWASILGGRGWGWACAWINLLGLVFVVASVDVGVWLLFKDLVLGGVFGVDVSGFGLTHQIIAVALILASQALFNHIGIRATTILTDFSGYLILVVAIVLTAALLFSAPSIDIGRLFTFTNNTGDAGGGVWPMTGSAIMAFGIGMLLPAYTVTGFDASAHTSEETRSAQTSVPRGMLASVFWSFLFGYFMICSFVLAMPDTTEGAKQGLNVIFWTIDGSGIPGPLKDILYIGIVAANYLCALAGMTSFSRMIFAFARDGGLPKVLAKVSPTYRTPVQAVWTAAVLAFVSTLYSPAFAALAAGCAVFLYLSYAMPIGAGLLAEGKSWTTFGPFRLGIFSKPFAAITVLFALGLTFLGLQPPNDILINYGLGILVLLVFGWFVIERKRFKGPPVGDVIKKRLADIKAAEAAVGEKG
ncbi:amino acid permease [Zavarzinia aquatilis]|uniref:Amino acid permease n=1 Tax=Zavarzinia aquatilis TaxID=2211142 RepID=A0A317DU10_9PROT|nr:amino acid permease [Zavarzinia aquatilis]PWR18131.1 amino acid permease [Zavarzinia aquatilis]